MHLVLRCQSTNQCCVAPGCLPAKLLPGFLPYWGYFLSVISLAFTTRHYTFWSLWAIQDCGKFCETGCGHLLLGHTYNFFLFQYLWLSLSATYLGSNPGCTATGYMIVARRSNLAVSEFIHLYKRIPIVHNS